MTVLKWVLVIFGVMFLAAAAAMVGIFYWASNVPTVQVTEADLAIGDDGIAREDQRAPERKSPGCQLLSHPGGQGKVERTGIALVPDHARDDEPPEQPEQRNSDDAAPGKLVAECA